MPLWHSDLKKKKITGGTKKPARTKRAFEQGGFASETRLGDPLKVAKRIRSGALKGRLLYERYANVMDQSRNVVQKAEILRVIKNPVNPDYDRRKIITKGALIETSLGEAVVTSRPGQDGVINAIIKRG